MRARAATQQLSRMAGQLKCKPEELETRLSLLQDQAKALEKALAGARQQLAAAQADSLLDEAQEVAGIRRLAAQVEVADPAGLKDMANTLASKLGPSVVVLAATSASKVSVCAQCSPEAVKAGYHAGSLIRHVTAQIGGKGGGKPAFAMGGGSMPEALPKALQTAFEAHPQMT